MHLQTTISKTVRCSGVGLHSGRKVGLELIPADADSGIVFCLKTLDGEKFITPSPENVVGTGLATTLGNGDGSVATVEHLLAALRGLGIDNILVKADGSEIPIMDGSAASFVYLLRSAGLSKLNKPRRVLAVTKSFEHKDGEKSIKARPYNGFSVDYLIDFDHPYIGSQVLSFELTPESFVRRIAKARTFGFLKEVELLHKNGLALGGSLDNAVVLDEYGVINDEGLRYKDEFVRHKVLDFIGDMAVAPLPIHGHFEVSCSGHAFNNEFLRLLTDREMSCLKLQELAADGVRPVREARPEAVLASAVA
ncbi:UDP-3-O-acyl-N-acetylglucosamine deacetylase [Desulfovibrio ferrophilus]|uniref:UDP-3-O-acyl-N-acetylglucosamine deacetylase n=1 Tax=Desulfovibrio ferrophilus TaxID=241368 RepID=A0A2Z6AV72_9BACT|nr:UDP-3-O-acyl-N-acetylglucosamine deacetylase [Desulfovibrio ferrophilus]BBD07095.1 UDP-3-0-acyl N-acetylglucosamine deacetylase [Desulfovibrio ferrophilus]